MSEVLTKFTRKVPHWQPRITPVDLETASDEQKDALQITPSGTKISEYVLVLAHDPESLKVRSPLFNEIMYGEGGLARADREVGAIAASVVNKCIFCAAVHANRHEQYTKDSATTDAIFTGAPLPEREAVLFEAGRALSQNPPALVAGHIEKLRGLGLSETEILDLILSTALFGWANRLMHILGDPVRTPQKD